MKIIISIVIVIMVVLGVAGCRDPYSERRIRLRWESFSETATDIQTREARGPEKMEAAGRTLEKWWRSDSERFERRLRTVGDYAW